MGADIHAYVEYKYKNGEHWMGFGGQLRLGRDYHMFGLLANVRSAQGSALFEPKGLPCDLGFQSFDDSTLRCTNDEALAESEGYCSQANATKWVANGSAKWVTTDPNYPRITHPDWHSHSWLTLAEYNAVLKKYKETGDGRYEAGYDAVLAIMKAYAKVKEDKKPVYDVRLVFWFDS